MSKSVRSAVVRAVNKNMDAIVATLGGDLLPANRPRAESYDPKSMYRLIFVTEGDGVHAYKLTVSEVQ